MMSGDSSLEKTVVEQEELQVAAAEALGQLAAESTALDAVDEVNMSVASTFPGMEIAEVIANYSKIVEQNEFVEGIQRSHAEDRRDMEDVSSTLGVLLAEIATSNARMKRMEDDD